MLEHIISNDATPNDFATRHGWEPYLCRYRDCPRAIQGFNSSVLRQEHENSHTPRFRCNDVACEVLGSDLISRTALNKHNKKYHDGNSLAAIPTSLRKACAHPQQDRLCFLLKEPSSNSRKRSSHAVEEDNVLSEVDGATTPAQSSQDPESSTDDDQTRDCIIKCICGPIRFEDGEFFESLNCGSCDTAQHVRCYYTNEHGEFVNFKDHFCIDCKPRPIDVKLATTRQRERKKKYSEYLHLRILIGKENKRIERQAKLEKDMVWSVLRNEVFLRSLICHLGTDWEAIAKDMKMRGHHMVC